MTTRFDMENQAIQRRIADYLKRIAEALEKMTKETGKREHPD